MWSSVTPERAHRYIYEETGLDRAEGDMLVGAQVDAAKKALDKANKALEKHKNTKTTNIPKYIKDKEVLQQKIDDAQVVVDYWNNVKSINQIFLVNLQSENHNNMTGEKTDTQNITYSTDGKILLKVATPRLDGYIVPEGVEAIADGAFANCDSLNYIYFPRSLKKIGAEAFRCCHRLTNVIIPSSVEEMGARCFYDCHCLNEIHLSDGMRAIEESTFEFCRKLGRVVLPEALEEIKPNAFADCFGLSGVTLPSSLKRIGSQAFANCISIEGLVLPEGLEEIGEMAFIGCSGLGDIHVPGSVKALASDAFLFCE